MGREVTAAWGALGMARRGPGRRAPALGEAGATAERDGGTRGRRRTGVVGAVSGVLLAVLAGCAAPSGSEGGTGGRGRVDSVAAPADDPVRPFAAPGEDPEPEKCEDGSDPAESLKPSGGAGEAVERIQDRGRLVVGVDQNSFLWGYRDPTTGKLGGFDIDLAKEIGKDILGTDPDITFKTIPTDQRIPALEKGDVDMVVRTMTISCERIEEVAFSTAYFEAGQQMLVPKDHARVKGFDKSLEGRRLCYASGSTAETLMKEDDYRQLGARTLRVPNQLDCLVRVQLGEADAIVTDSALGAGQAAQDPSVRLIGEPVTVEPYGVAMNLEDEDLVRRVNKVLDDYRKGGAGSKWRAAYDEWLADDMKGTGEGGAPKPPEPKYRD